VKWKPTVGSPFFGDFRSGRIPKETKDVNIPFFIYSSNPSKLDMRIPVSYTSEFWNLLKLLRYTMVLYRTTCTSSGVT
jgi:hypothetical protein